MNCPLCLAAVSPLLDDDIAKCRCGAYVDLVAKEDAYLFATDAALHFGIQDEVAVTNPESLLEIRSAAVEDPTMTLMAAKPKGKG